MPEIKYTEVLSYSSEDVNHPADNMLQPEAFRKWKCAANTSEKQAFVILKFGQLTTISSIDIGNDGSALVEVLVSREGLSDYQLLLVSSSFMSPAESRNGTDLHRVRMFGPDKLNKKVAEQKWDRLKVICTQPFNTKMQFGLSFITARTLENGKKDSSQKVTHLGSFKLKMEDDSDSISVGSMFAKRNENTSFSSTGPAAIRAAAREAPAAAASPARPLKRKEIPADEDTNQLKKKAAKESIRSPMPKDSPSTSHTTNQKKEKQTEKHSKPNSKPERNEAKPNRKGSEGREEKEKRRESWSKNKEKTNKPSSSKADTQDTAKKRKSKPFTSLMDNVVFVISGYQNPERSTLRDKLTEMGGQYKSDWSPGCTHLICAFTNTPKYRQIKGKGKIVSGKWITECYKNKIRYPWRRYGLEKRVGDAESEEEVWAEEILPKVSKPSVKTTPKKPADDPDEDVNYSDDVDTDDEIQKVLDRQHKTEPGVASDNEEKVSNNSKKDNSKPSSEKDKARTIKQSEKNYEKDEYERNNQPENNKDSSATNGHKDSSDDEAYEDDTDIDDELLDTSSLPLPTLGDYFRGICFLLYGKMADEKRKLLTRYITAYNGQIEDYMSEKVNFVISDDKWDDNFEEALNDNPALQFVKAQWIWQCCDKKKLAPHQPYLIVPNE